MLLRVGLFLLPLLAFAQTPRINGIVNAASYARSDSPNGALARGSIVTIFCDNCGPQTLTRATTLPLPTELAGTSLRITSGTQVLDGIVLYTSAGQVAAVIPSNAPLGVASVTLTYAGRPSNPFTIRIAERSIGVFSQNQQGTGPAVAYNFVSEQSQPLNVPGSPATPNQILVLYLTGLGGAPGDDRRPVSHEFTYPLEASVDGRPAEILYKGRSSCCVGVDQINLRMPAGVDKCFATMNLRVDGLNSPPVTVAGVPRLGGTCTAANGLTGPDLDKANQGGAFAFGLVDFVYEQVKLEGFPFFFYDEYGTGTFFSMQGQAFIGEYGIDDTPVGTCTARQLPVPTTQTPPLPGFRLLDVGTLTLAKNQFNTRQFAKDASGYFLRLTSRSQQNAQAYLEPGGYTISGTGSAEVGAFSQNFLVQPLLQWTNEFQIGAITRGQPLTLTWFGGEPGSIVRIYGWNAYGGVGAEFTCYERAERRTFTIPGNITAVLPPTFADPPADYGLLTIGAASSAQRLSTPPRGLDAGAVVVTSSVTKGVGVR